MNKSIFSFITLFFVLLFASCSFPKESPSPKKGIALTTEEELRSFLTTDHETKEAYLANAITMTDDMTLRYDKTLYLNGQTLSDQISDSSVHQCLFYLAKNPSTNEASHLTIVGKGTITTNKNYVFMLDKAVLELQNVTLQSKETSYKIVSEGKVKESSTTFEHL